MIASPRSGACDGWPLRSYCIKRAGAERSSGRLLKSPMRKITGYTSISTFAFSRYLHEQSERTAPSRSAGALARVGRRGDVTVSDRPEGRPVPHSRARLHANANTRNGTNDETSTERRIPAQQATMSDEERGHPGSRRGRRATLTSRARIPGTDRRPRPAVASSPRYCATSPHPGHRAKAPAMKGTQQHKP